MADRDGPGVGHGIGGGPGVGAVPEVPWAQPANGSNGGGPAASAAPPTPPAAPLMPPALPPGAETTGQMGAVAQSQAAASQSGAVSSQGSLPVQIPPSAPSDGAASAAVPAVAPVARAFPLIPEPEEDGDGSGAPGRNYVIGGNVLGIVLAVITVVALVWALVIALRTDNTPEALAARAAASKGSNSSGDSGALDTDTSTGAAATDATAGGAAAAAAGTDALGAAAGGDAAAGGGEAGGGGGGGGAFKFAPAAGTYAVSGSGFRKNTPPGNSTAVSDPSLVVTAAGGGCFSFKFNMDPGNYNDATLCGTTDGGVVLTKNVQYLKTVIVGNVAEENTASMTCSPPDIILPANPAPGASGAGGGNCIGKNSTPKAPGQNKQTSTFTVVGKETVSGVEAWHVHRAIKLAPADSQNTQNGTIEEDYWFATNNGMVMRWKQVTNATSVVASVINVVFQQQSDMTVTSPNPG